MKVKVYVLDFEIPARFKKWGLRIGIPAAMLIVGGVAFAGLPGGYQDGQPLTKAILDANFNYLQSEITPPGVAPRTPSAFRAERQSPLTIPNGNPDTQVAFDSVAFDIGGEYNGATGVFSPNGSGHYLVTCGLAFPATTGAYYSVNIVVGTNYLAVGGSTSGGGAFVAPGTSTVVLLNKGDQVSCHTYQGSGAAVQIDQSQGRQYNTFSAARLY